MKSSQNNRQKMKRTLFPGSECLYFKIYCSENNGDYLLHNIIYTFMQSRKDENLFQRWFFIRYGNPDWHLRLRLFGDPCRLLTEVLPYFTKTLNIEFTNKRLHKFEVGTYRREIERYGGNEGMLACESLFTFDSEAVLKLLRLYGNNQMLNERWKIAMIGVDKIFNDFGFDVKKKLEITKRLSESFGDEFRAGPVFKKSLSTRFRAEKDELHNLLDEDRETSELQTEAVDILDKRSAQSAPFVESIMKYTTNDASSEDLDSIVCSLVHMHINRFLRSAHRAQELVIYNFLQRVYRSICARDLRPNRTQQTHRRTAMTPL